MPARGHRFGAERVGPTGAFIVYGITQQHGYDGLAMATLMAGFTGESAASDALHAENNSGDPIKLTRHRSAFLSMVTTKG